ncbi:MAG: hypothetical protein R8G66_15600 [Cytophagales bacterium]|nr:hypothetical protein [Cytophagales bacterium]
MHIQPNSDQIRKYIPISTYFRWMEAERNRSFIGLPLNLVEASMIQQRIQQLEEQEKSGFVYVGEKSWLLSYVQDQAVEYQNYEQWVLRNFKEFLGLDFEISPDYPHLNHTIWQAEFDAEEMVLGYEELKNPGYLDIDEIEVLIGGNGQSPSVAHVVKAFEFLHNLEYAIATIPIDQGTRELSVTGIDVSNPTDPCRWELDVISEYGGDLEKTIVNGVSWRST